MLDTSTSRDTSSSAAVLPASSDENQVLGEEVTRTLPRTGFDPGLLLMIGGMFVISGVLMLRYSDDRQLGRQS